MTKFAKAMFVFFFFCLDREHQRNKDVDVKVLEFWPCRRGNQLKLAR